MNKVNKVVEKVVTKGVLNTSNPIQKIAQDMARSPQVNKPKIQTPLGKISEPASVPFVFLVGGACLAGTAFGAYKLMEAKREKRENIVQMETI